MGSNIDRNTTVQPQTAPQNPETPVEPTIINPDYSGYADGNENGGIYFELNWQTGQAHYRQQNLLSTYSGAPVVSDEPTIEPNFSGFYASSHSPESNGYGGNHYGYGNSPNGTLPYGNSENSAYSDYYGASANETGTLLPLEYLTENSESLSWKDFINLIKGSDDFSDFHNQPPNFWREVRQLSETEIVQNQDDIELESISKYEKLLNEMQSKKLPLDEFVKTLPPSEREVFKARFQIDETFGTDIFESDGVTLNETGQLRARQFAVETDQIELLPPNIRQELHEGKFAPVNDSGEPIVARQEISGDAENAVLFGENTRANRIVLEKIESGELKSPDKLTQIAIGNNAGSILTDNGTSRVINHIATDNSSSVNSIVRRDGGTVLGGALISGSFASVENFKNAENKGIGNSGSTSNANFGGGNGFAAGATGAMMSAAIGSLVPGSDAVVSGVVGFISGVVIGVEADQGLRWLSGDRPTAIVSPNNTNLLEENSFAPTLQPVLA